jgi:hypothetical protein
MVIHDKVYDCTSMSSRNTYHHPPIHPSANTKAISPQTLN